MPDADKLDRVIANLRETKIATFQINAMTRIGREELMGIFSAIFEEFDLDEAHLFNVYSGIVEVIFNAIKANVKFLLFQDELSERIQATVPDVQAEDMLKVILQEDPLREYIDRFAIPPKLKSKVQDILMWDESVRTKRGRLDEKQLAAYREFRDRLHDKKLEVHFTIGLGDNYVVLTVVNDSPILRKDMQRLRRSREIHFSLFQEGRSAEFFTPEYMDQTESAGYGIAMADEIYFELGLNPKESFTIDSEGNKTTALMKFPRELLAKK